MTKQKKVTIAAGVLSMALFSSLLPASQPAYGKESVASALINAGTTSSVTVPDSGSTPTAPSQEHKHHHRRHFFGGYAIKTTAELIGMDKQQLVKELKAGRTLVQIVKDKKGWSESEYISKLTESSSKRIDEAVKDGKIDADKAGKLKAVLPAKLKEAVNRNWSKELENYDAKTTAPNGIFRQHEAKMLQESN